MTARIGDINGWFEVANNPLSKVGIFDYSGAQVGAPPAEAGRIFRVFRPEEELSNPDAIQSFRLAPIVDGHAMLGDEARGLTPAEKKGVHGVIGEDLSFSDGFLRGNLKIFSTALAQKIKSGKTELSCGYRCTYDFTPGTWQGQAYDVVQRNIRANHVALVDEGRMGPEVAVLDAMCFTVDAMEATPVDLTKLKAALAAVMAELDVLGGSPANPAPAAPVAPAPAKDADPAPSAPPAPPTKDADPVPPAPPVPPAKDADPAPSAPQAPPAKDEDETATPATMDAALKMIGSLRGKLAAKAPAAAPAMDEKAIVSQLSARTKLVERLTKHIGVFDHADMTTSEVAAYGVKKLGIVCPAGTEAVALDGYLQAKPAPTPVTPAHDAAPTGLAAAIAKHVEA